MSVVVGHVDKPEGHAALEAAAEHALAGGVPLVVVSSTRGDALVDSGYLGDEAAAALLAPLRERGVEVRLERRVGTDPAHAVLDVARELDAHLVVVGLRRRSPVGKLVLGSSAQQVLLGADCPVLAVKAPR
jgi:nucleotide-binding universal stress UspA family protein